MSGKSKWDTDETDEHGDEEDNNQLSSVLVSVRLYLRM